ncbi:MAG: DUF4129 domain-containing protein [Armatimonadota bacterium]
MASASELPGRPSGGEPTPPPNRRPTVAGAAPIARQRLRIELWSWSAWLILAILSYPALLLIWVAPWAGLLGGLIVGLLVAYTASAGYAGRRELEGWLPAMGLVILSGGSVAALALVGDRRPLPTSLLCGLIAASGALFAWNFLPWLVRDADFPEGTAPHAGSPVRAALGLVLMLGLLALGLGAAWAKGEARVPSPTLWVIGLGLLCLAFMFVERMAFLERAARQGNLLMAPASYRGWVGLALLTLLLSAALAYGIPWRLAKKEATSPRTGTAALAAAAQSAAARLTEGTEDISSAASDLRAIGGRAALALALFLLLLLLLLAILLLWLFRRTRAARWLARMGAALLALIGRAWRRLCQLLVGKPPAPARAAAPPAADEDPLRDIFSEPDLLAGMTAREIAIRAYHLLLNFAEMLGHGRRDAQTPFEYARMLQTAAPSASESVLVLTWAYSGAMYGGELAPAPDPGAIRDSWLRARETLTSGVSEEDIALRRRAYLAARRMERR